MAGRTHGSCRRDAQRLREGLETLGLGDRHRADVRWLFGGNVQKTRRFLHHEYGYMNKMISKSHLNRRIHAIEPALWRMLFELFAQLFKQRNYPEFQTYALDSLPVPVCDNILKSAAAEFTLWKKKSKDMTTRRPPRKSRSAATSRASGATSSTAYGCIWWSRERESRWSSFPWRGARRPTLGSSRSWSWTSCLKVRSSGPRKPTHRLRLGGPLLEEVGVCTSKLRERKKNSKRPMAAWEEFLGKPIRQYIERVFSGLRSLFVTFYSARYRKILTTKRAGAPKGSGSL
jgi:hypothetical protein